MNLKTNSFLFQGQPKCNKNQSRFPHKANRNTTKTSPAFLIRPTETQQKNSPAFPSRATDIQKKKNRRVASFEDPHSISTPPGGNARAARAIHRCLQDTRLRLSQYTTTQKMPSCILRGSQLHSISIGGQRGRGYARLAFCCRSCCIVAVFNNQFYEHTAEYKLE